MEPHWRCERQMQRNSRFEARIAFSIRRRGIGTKGRGRLTKTVALIKDLAAPARGGTFSG